MTTSELPPRLVSDAPVDADLARVRRLTAYATVAAVCLAIAAATAAAAASPPLTLLPIAFVLGWLNLVGL